MFDNVFALASVCFEIHADGYRFWINFGRRKSNFYEKIQHRCRTSATEFDTCLASRHSASRLSGQRGFRAIGNNSIKSNPISRSGAQHEIAPSIHRNSWKTRFCSQNAMKHTVQHNRYEMVNNNALDFPKHELTVNHVRKQCRQS